MSMLWAAGGAVLGLPAGTLLRGAVFRLSGPGGTADQTSCAHCGGPVRSWVVGVCRRCGHTIGSPWLLECVTAAVLGLLFGRFGGQPDMLAFGFLGALGVALGAIDIAVQRLPDRLVLPAYPVLTGLFALAAVTGHDTGALLRALLGGLVLGGFYLVLALLRPGGIGGGDVKLAGLAGLALGWLGWPALIVGGTLGFILSAMVSLALLAARRITLHSVMCFGPFLLSGVLLAALATSH
jgi:leader peptidase (prepilin peptidase) / N-methyltransferase